MSDAARNGLRPWTVLGQQLLLSAPPWLAVYQERVELPTRRVLDDFYRIVLPDFVEVVPVTESGEIIMVRGYKHGLGDVTLSPPSGMIHADEEPLLAARRELLEETGYEAPEWENLGRYVVDGNRQCGNMHLFVARGARRVRPPDEDEMEELQVEFMTPQQVLDALRAGEYRNLAGAGAVALAVLLGTGVAPR
jgi:ADP-ribose pyrophosphatase